MSRYHDSQPEPVPHGHMRPYDYDYNEQAYNEPKYPPRPPPQSRRWSPSSAEPYDENDYTHRRSRPGYKARSARSYDTRSTPTSPPPSTTPRRDGKPSWVVTGVLTGLVVLAFTGIQVWAHRVSDGKSGVNRERRRREKAFDDAKRSRRRDEERREREEEEENSFDDERKRPDNRRRIEYIPTKRQRSRSTAVRKLEAPRHDDDDDREDDVRTVRDYDDDRWARHRRDDR